MMRRRQCGCAGKSSQKKEYGKQGPWEGSKLGLFERGNETGMAEAGQETGRVEKRRIEPQV